MGGKPFEWSNSIGELKDIIAKIEKATGPSRELDEEISQVIGVALAYTAVIGCSPAYTASLDAAASLVPDGWFWSMQVYDDGTFAKVAKHPKAKVCFRGWHKPPAIALCIAALRARLEVMALEIWHNERERRFAVRDINHNHVV